MNVWNQIVLAKKLNTGTYYIWQWYCFRQLCQVSNIYVGFRGLHHVIQEVLSLNPQIIGRNVGDTYQT
jgi:hypothetical protein